MIVEVDGVRLYVPDDATPDEIDALSKPVAAPRMGDLQAAEGARNPRPVEPAPTRLQSGARGGFQGLTMGFGDELAAGVASVLPFTDPEAARGDTVGERYKNARDFYRNLNDKAEKANPNTYMAGQVAGAVAPALAGVGVGLQGRKAAALAAGQGAVQGAGYSEANDPTRLAGDIVLGAGLGTTGYGAGKVLGAGLSKVAGKARQIGDFARARAGVQASTEVAEQVQSAAGQLGAETQKGSRYIENLMRLKESMTPEQRALYESMEASGVVPGLQRSVAGGTLAAVPDQAATIAAKKAALDAAQSGAPDAVKQRTADLLTSKIPDDVKSFLKSYAEPVAWAYGGHKVAEALGADPEKQGMAAAVAGLIGGRTRAGKALMTRVNRPANQLAFAESLKRAAENGSPLAQALLQRAVPAGVMASFMPGEE